MKIILASKSPRRKELLKLIVKEFEIVCSDVDETLPESGTAAEKICEISRRKAAAVLKETGKGNIIISADTAVISGNDILGKPKDENDAFCMLKALSNKTHSVITAFTVTDGEKTVTDYEETKVTFRALEDSEISGYIKTGEPLDKAGAYGIQGYASAFIKSISGDYFSVVGLPVCRLCEVLKEFGISQFKGEI